MLNTIRLRAFIKMVDTGSMTRAADQLSIAQPALSQQVSALEARLGVQLLVRSRQGIRPTPAGRALYRHAQLILKQITQAEADVRSAHNELAGEVSVGMPLTTAGILATPLLKAVTARHPGIRLHIADGLTGGLLSELTMNARLDMTLLSGDAHVRGLSSEALITERMVLIGPPGAAFAMKGQVAIRELKGRPLLLPSATNRLRQLVDAAFAAEGMTPVVAAELDSVQSLCGACADGLGFTILPASASRQASGLEMHEIIDPEIERTILIATPEATPLSSPALAVYALIIDLVTELTQRGDWPGARLVPRGDMPLHGLGDKIAL